MLQKKGMKITKSNIEGIRQYYGKLLIFACFFLYTASMAAKGIFAAEQQYIVNLWDLEYAKVSMANTFYYVPYGFMQFLLFVIMSKIDIKKYILFTVPISVLTTILIGTASNIYQIWIYFGLSGFFQAGIFCGCNYILTKYLPNRLLSSANRVMNLGFAFGTVIAYGVCALCIRFGGWQLPYFIIGALFALSVVCFAFVVFKVARFKRINEILDKKDEKQKNVLSDDIEEPLFRLKNKKEIALFYIVDLLLTFFIISLYYAIMNYITSLLVDVYGMAQDVSIYVSVIAPIACSLGPMLTIYSCDRERDFIRTTIIYMSVVLPIPALLALFYDVNIVLALALSVIFVIVINGVRSISLSVITFKMRKQINAGAYSAISNGVASISAGVAPAVVGKIIDMAGWSVSYWTVFSVATAVVVLLIVIDCIVRKKSKIRFGS